MCYEAANTVIELTRANYLLAAELTNVWLRNRGTLLITWYWPNVFNMCDVKLCEVSLSCLSRVNIASNWRDGRVSGRADLSRGFAGYILARVYPRRVYIREKVEKGSRIPVAFSLAYVFISESKKKLIPALSRRAQQWRDTKSWNVLRKLRLTCTIYVPHADLILPRFRFIVPSAQRISILCDRVNELPHKFVRVLHSRRSVCYKSNGSMRNKYVRSSIKNKALLS